MEPAVHKPSASLTIDIPFHDVDILGVVWHGHYYKYFELARTALFRAYGFDIEEMRAQGVFMYITDSRCRYHQALRYGMLVEVRATLVEWEYRLAIEYTIRDAQGRKLARGATTQVTMEAATGKLRLVTPPAILERFQLIPTPEEKPHD